MSATRRNRFIPTIEQLETRAMPSGNPVANVIAEPAPPPGLVQEAPGVSGDAATNIVAGLYHQMLHREADAQGLASYSQALMAGTSVPQVVSTIWNSPEYYTLEITRYYKDYLERDPATAEVNWWAKNMLQGMPEEQVVAGVLTSAEFFSKYPANADFVTAVYQLLLNRAPDSGELTSWKTALDSGTPRGAVVSGLLASTEFHSDRLNFFYASLLGRPADPSGLQNWVSYWSQPGVTIRNVESLFLSSAENVSYLSASASWTLWGSDGPVGQWTVTGQTPAGQPYEAALTISRSSGTFLAEWHSPELGNLTGYGFVSNGLLVIARARAPQLPGVNVYTLTGDASLRADWTIGDTLGLLGTGMATRSPPGPLVGSWQITYYDPWEVSYPLDLEISQDGPVSDLTWRAQPGSPALYSGVGLPTPNGMAAAYAPPAAIAISPLDLLVFKLDHGNAGSATATWTTTGQRTLGTEKITRVPPSSNGSIIVTAPDAGEAPNITVFDPTTHAQLLNFNAYDPNFTGGVRVAVGDVNGDGIPDIITAPGPGGSPYIEVFDGITGTLIRGFMAFDPSFTGGVNVAAGDVNDDGSADIICAPDGGGGPFVKVFSGLDGSLLNGFYAYGAGFTGGVRVAAGDVNGDNFADIICAPGAGGGPYVTVWSGKDGSLLSGFYAYSAGFTAGVYVTAGDVTGAGQAEIITGAGAGGSPNVSVFSGVDGSLIESFLAYDSAFTGGVRVATAQRNDGSVAVVTVAGPGGGAQVSEFNGLTGASIDSFFASNPMFSAGLWVGGA